MLSCTLDGVTGNRKFVCIGLQSCHVVLCTDDIISLEIVCANPGHCQSEVVYTMLCLV